MVSEYKFQQAHPRVYSMLLYNEIVGNKFTGSLPDHMMQQFSFPSLMMMDSLFFPPEEGRARLKISLLKMLHQEKKKKNIIKDYLIFLGLLHSC